MKSQTNASSVRPSVRSQTHARTPGHPDTRTDGRPPSSPPVARVVMPTSNDAPQSHRGTHARAVAIRGWIFTIGRFHRSIRSRRSVLLPIASGSGFACRLHACFKKCSKDPGPFFKTTNDDSSIWKRGGRRKDFCEWMYLWVNSVAMTKGPEFFDACARVRARATHGERSSYISLRRAATSTNAPFV